MNQSTAFRRKIIYIVVLLLMLLPLYKLGQPATGGGAAGGELSRLRHKYNIAESDLGEISPASETMKLATLGLRGVAASILWGQADDYQKLHEWDRLKATLNNIALLQPHYEKVWEHQAHNLAYNVSAQFDDYRQRYEMVREGTEFLTRGVKQNREAPRLIWYTGWFYGSKMGTADEKKQFRRLFSEDEVLHKSLLEQNIAVDSPEARGPLGKPDNWLVGRLWLNYGYKLVDDAGVRITRQTPINFFETGPKWRIKHAEAIEREGILDDRAQNAWGLAKESWDDFGQRTVPTLGNIDIKLDGLVDLSDRRDERLAEFQGLTGDEYIKGFAAKINAPVEKVLAAKAKKFDDRTEEEKRIVDYLQGEITPDLMAIAKASDPKVRLKAIQLAGELASIESRYMQTDGYRDQVNYPYWQALTIAEQEEQTVRARRLIYQAEKANAEARLDESIELYEEAFAIWADIFKKYPILIIDDAAESLMQSVRRYMIAIDSEEPPEDFPLVEFVETVGFDGQASHRVKIQIKEESERMLRRRKREIAERGELSEDANPAAETVNEAAATEVEPDQKSDDADENNANGSEANESEANESDADDSGANASEQEMKADGSEDTVEASQDEDGEPEGEDAETDETGSDQSGADETDTGETPAENEASDNEPAIEEVPAGSDSQ